jgi:hypothetical protein
MDRQRFLLLVGALTACHEARDTHQAVTLSAIATPPQKPHEQTFCESIAKQNDAVLANPQASAEALEQRASQCGEASEKTVRAELTSLREHASFLTYCHEGKGGVWAVVLVSASLDDPGGEGPGCGWAASYELAHQRDPTKTSGAVMSPKRDYLAWLNEHDTSTIEKAFDYDNDGQDELIVSSEQWENGGGGDGPSVIVWRARGDKIEGYPTPKATSVTDADGDGRPDLVNAAFFAAECDGGLAPRMELGAPMLLHALPNGTFSASDEVARRWAVTECPTMPTVKPLDTVSATCQLLWGRSRDAILKDAAPVTPGGANFCDDQPNPSRMTALIAPAVPFKTLNVDTPLPYPKKSK